MSHLGPSTIDAVDVSFDRQSLPDAVCLGCGQQGLRQFYWVSSLPVHSCLLMDSARKRCSTSGGNCDSRTAMAAD